MNKMSIMCFVSCSGVMLHYDTPALSHLFFVDPQWLCDMLAHVVTVPEVNNFIVRGTGTKILHTNTNFEKLQKNASDLFKI